MGWRPSPWGQRTRRLGPRGRCGRLWARCSRVNLPQCHPRTTSRVPRPQPPRPRPQPGRPEQQGEPLAPHATHPRGPRPPAALLARPQFPRHGGGAGVNPSRKGGGQAPPSETQERTPPSLPPSKRLRENVQATRFPNACEAVRGLGPVSRPRADPGPGRLARGGGRTCGRARRGPTCEGGTLPSPGSVGGSPG